MCLHAARVSPASRWLVRACSGPSAATSSPAVAQRTFSRILLPSSSPPPTLPPAGGHNVIIGLHDYLQRWHPGSTLVGFLNGPRGVMQNNYKELSAAELVRLRKLLHCCTVAQLHSCPLRPARHIHLLHETCNAAQLCLRRLHPPLLQP